jgi:hypothetical protein
MSVHDVSRCQDAPARAHASIHFFTANCWCFSIVPSAYSLIQALERCSQAKRSFKGHRPPPVDCLGVPSPSTSASSSKFWQHRIRHSPTSPSFALADRLAITSPFTTRHLHLCLRPAIARPIPSTSGDLADAIRATPPETTSSPIRPKCRHDGDQAEEVPSGPVL